MPRNPFQRMVFAFVSRHLFIQPHVRRVLENSIKAEKKSGIDRRYKTPCFFLSKIPCGKNRLKVAPKAPKQRKFEQNYFSFIH